MFAGLRNGVALATDALRTLLHHPSLLAPLLLCWAAYATAAGYLRFFFPWDDYPRRHQLYVALGFAGTVTLLLALCGLLLLAIYRQLERGERPRFMAGAGEALRSGLLRALPVMVLWALLWCAVALAGRFLRGEELLEGPIGLTAERVARTVAGLDGYRFSTLFALVTLLRLLAFFTLPAIAWENRSFFRAIYRGYQVLAARKVEFVTGFLLIQAAVGLLFLPAGVLFLLSMTGMRFPDWVWFLTIGEAGIAWSVLIYLEQMFTALLFDWQARWEEACADATSEYREQPPFEEVPRPSFPILAPAR